jgi:hypothetical protein
VVYPSGTGTTIACNGCTYMDGSFVCTALACVGGCNMWTGLGDAYYESDGCVYCVCEAADAYSEPEIVCNEVSPCITCTDDGVTYYPGDAWDKTCAVCNCTDTVVDGVVVGEVVCMETC